MQDYNPDGADWVDPGLGGFHNARDVKPECAELEQP